MGEYRGKIYLGKNRALRAGTLCGAAHGRLACADIAYAPSEEGKGMKKRQWRMMVCLGTLLALGCLYAAWEMHPSGTATLPGTGERQRTILRVWDVDGPTGSSAWLRAQCGKFDKIMPGLNG